MKNDKRAKRFYWIMEERKRLNKLTENMPSKKKQLFEGLIENASFISSMIREIEETTDGLTLTQMHCDDCSNECNSIIDNDLNDTGDLDDTTVNGLYNSLIKRYAEIMEIINPSQQKRNKRIEK